MPVSNTVTGMVLSAIPIGDYDKRVVILTKELGKISAFAKGARRPNSALLACTQPFSFGQFGLYYGRSSYNITSCDIASYFPELRNDIDSLYYGMYFCEFTDYITKENNDETQILKLLYQTLKAVAKKTIPLPLIRAIFELKIISLEGEGPQVFQCVKCEKPLDASGNAGEYSFSPECRGLLCEGCRRHDYSARRLNCSTTYAMQYIVSKGIEKLYTFTVTGEVLEELALSIEKYLSLIIDHEFKSLEAVKSLNEG
jgi:DNA repair protein RecO (recombination protein O)